MPSVKFPVKKSLDEVLLTGRGLVSENYPLGAAASASIMIDGTVYFMLVGLRAGQVVTGAAISVSTGGTTMSLSKYGLYDTAGTRLAVSADQSTAWASGGNKQGAFTAAYTVPADGVYYAAVVAKASTLPTLYRQAASNAASVAFTGGSALFGLQLAQTDLPTSATIATNSSAQFNYWIGLY